MIRITSGCNTYFLYKKIPHLLFGSGADFDVRRSVEQQMTVVVFDIGGVLVKLGGMSKFVRWTGQDPETVKSKWLSSEAVRSFETGNVTFEPFASAVIEEFGLPLSTDQLRVEMASWMGELFDDAHEILENTSAKHQIACLCNLNEIQWPRVRDELGLGKRFPIQFISYEIGLAKPDPNIYEYVKSQLNVDPEQIWFFDDSLPNVEGAQDAGWNAYYVRGTIELREHLSTLGLI